MECRLPVHARWRKDDDRAFSASGRPPALRAARNLRGEVDRALPGRGEVSGRANSTWRYSSSVIAPGTARMYIAGVRPRRQSGVAGHLSSIDDRNAWIGRSNYNDAERNATVHEVRIYAAALSTARVTSSYNAGPDP